MGTQARDLRTTPTPPAAIAPDVLKKALEDAAVSQVANPVVARHADIDFESRTVTLVSQHRLDTRPRTETLPIAYLKVIVGQLITVEGQSEMQPATQPAAPT